MGLYLLRMYVIQVVDMDAAAAAHCTMNILYYDCTYQVVDMDVAALAKQVTT